MAIRFKDYLLERKDTFFEKYNPILEEDETEEQGEETSIEEDSE